MQLSASIFKAYDIRGVVPVTLDTEVAEALGRAFGSAARAAGEKSVAVGRDGRLSGPALAEALIEGLVATGVEVIDMGAVTTPMLYFAAHTLARAASRSPAATAPRTTTASRWCWPAVRSTATRSRACARPWKLAPLGLPRAAACARST